MEEIGTGEAGSTASDRIQVDTGIKLDLLGIQIENLTKKGET